MSLVKNLCMGAAAVVVAGATSYMLYRYFKKDVKKGEKADEAVPSCSSDV